MRVLVTGWFSFEEGHATAGDVLAKDVVCAWLKEAGFPYDVAATPPFEGDLEWAAANPSAYTHVVFVCGPFRPGSPLTELMDRFAGRQFIGVNLSMLQPLEAWNPFDLLLERDSSRASRPDLSLLSQQPPAPLVGVALVHPQTEYGARQRHSGVNDAVRELLAGRDVAVVDIDTRLDVNRIGLGSAGQVEALIARMDLLVTSRLHGLVLALKNGVPAVAIDPIAGGAKITRQAEALGWPTVFTPESMTVERLREAFEYCLTPAARERARQCRIESVRTISNLKEPFLAAISRLARQVDTVPL